MHGHTCFAALRISMSKEMMSSTARHARHPVHRVSSDCMSTATKFDSRREGLLVSRHLESVLGSQCCVVCTLRSTVIMRCRKLGPGLTFCPESESCHIADDPERRGLFKKLEDRILIGTLRIEVVRGHVLKALVCSKWTNSDRRVTKHASRIEYKNR